MKTANLIRIGESCQVGDGTHSKIPRQESGVQYLTSRNFKDGGLDLSQVYYISEKDFAKHFLGNGKALTRPEHGDLVFSIIGTIGQPYLVREHDTFGLSSSVAIVRPDKTVIDPNFLFYWFKGPTFQNALFGIKGGVAQGYVSLEMIRSLPVPKLPLQLQRRIAAILSAYDDLIENNQRRIKILEEMARLLYREWFVNLRFPGHEKVPLVDSALGPIPEGWEVKSLADLMAIRGGSQPPKSEFLYEDQPGYIRLIQIRDYEADSHLTFVRESSKLRLCERGEIMIARYGASVARICSGLAGAYNVALAKVIPIWPNCQEFLRQFLSDDEFQKLLIGMSGRAAQNGFNKEDIAAVNVAVPNDRSLLERFEHFGVPIRDSILNLRDKIQNLRKTRNLLLPRLLSGQISMAYGVE